MDNLTTLLIARTKARREAMTHLANGLARKAAESMRHALWLDAQIATARLESFNTTVARDLPEPAAPRGWDTIPAGHENPELPRANGHRPNLDVTIP